MEECGWIGNTQRGQNCIYLILYDDMHYNALKLLNKKQKQTENATLNVRLDTKENRKRKGDPTEATNTTHPEPTQNNVRTGKNESKKTTIRRQP